MLGLRIGSRDCRKEAEVGQNKNDMLGALLSSEGGFSDEQRKMRRCYTKMHSKAFIVADERESA
ncbi:unnamed protein product [Rhodiola kirilowii]